MRGKTPSWFQEHLTSCSLGTAHGRNIHGGQDVLEVAELDGLVGGGRATQRCRCRCHRGCCGSRGCGWRKKVIKELLCRFKLSVSEMDVTWRSRGATAGGHS